MEIKFENFWGEGFVLLPAIIVEKSYDEWSATVAWFTFAIRVYW